MNCHLLRSLGLALIGFSLVTWTNAVAQSDTMASSTILPFAGHLNDMLSQSPDESTCQANTSTTTDVPTRAQATESEIPTLYQQVITFDSDMHAPGLSQHAAT